MARDKMSIEEFNEIKAFIAEEVALLKEHKDDFWEVVTIEQAEYYEKRNKEVLERIKESDLSEIPFEAYDGFYDLEFDFTDTGANIDFNIIDRSLLEEDNLVRPVRIRGCNVRNLNLSKIDFDEDSFDDDFMEKHKELFWAYETIDDKDVRRKYYNQNGNFTLSEIQKYGVQTDDPSLPNYIDKEKLMRKINCKEIASILPWEVVLKLKGPVVDIISYSLYMELQRIIDESYDISDKEGYSEIRETYKTDPAQLTDEQLELIQKNVLREKLDTISLEEYDQILQIPEARELVPEYCIDFGDNKDLKYRYCYGHLEIDDILDNPELFRGKSFLDRIDIIRIRTELKERGITEAKILYLMDNETELKEALTSVSKIDFIKIAQAIDVNLSVEENHKRVQQYIDNLITTTQNNVVNDVIEPFASEEAVIQSYGSTIQKLISEYGIEKYRSLGLTRVFLSRIGPKLINGLELFGLDGFLEYDGDNNNFFTKNGYENLVYYYDELSRTSDKDNKGNYTPEEIENLIVKTIVHNYSSNKYINPEELGKGFIERHQDFVLSEDAPDDLKNLYYSHQITIDDLKMHPKWNEYLSGKSFILFLQEFSDINKERFAETINQFVSKIDYYDAIDFLYRNKEIFRTMNLDISYKDGTTIEEFEKELFDKTYSKIKEVSQVGYTEDYPEKFQTEHPDLFLDKSIDEEIRRKFYSKSLTLMDVSEHPELVEQLKGKDLTVGFKKNVVIQFRDGYSEDAKKANKELMYLISVVSKYGASYLNAVLSDININELSEEKIEESIYTGILYGRINYKEDAPDFVKRKNPNLFLDKSAPKELKDIFYSRTIPSVKELKILFDPANKSYIEGKEFGVIISRNKWLANMSSAFSNDKILQLAEIDPEAITIYGESPTNAKLLKEALRIYAPQRAINDLAKEKGVDESDVREALKEDEALNQRYTQLLQLYEKLIFNNPGFVLYYPKERIDDFDFKEYLELKEKSKFEISPDYNREHAERIISNMYGRVGYEASKKIMEIPELTEEEHDSLIAQAGEEAKRLFETKYIITGEIRYLLELFKYLPTLLPREAQKKGKFKVYKNLNQKLAEGFEGNLEALIESSVTEAGYDIDQSKFDALLENISNRHNRDKMKSVKESVSIKIDERVPSILRGNKYIFKDRINDAIRKSLDKFERFDADFVKNEITNAINAPSDIPGQEYRYSDGVRGYLGELLRIVDEIDQNEELKAIMNTSFVDLLKKHSKEIPKPWIRKLNDLASRLDYEEYSFDKPLTVDEINDVEIELYGKLEEHDIPARSVTALKDDSPKGQREAAKILMRSDDNGILTLQKAEMMFSGLDFDLSPEFIKFFFDNKLEIMTNPEIYGKFAFMAQGFLEVIEKNKDKAASFKKGELTAAELLKALDSKGYTGKKEGFYYWEMLAKSQGLSQEEFEDGKKIIEKMREREYQTIPPSNKSNKRFRGRLLRGDDEMHLQVGYDTGCCQVVNHAGAPSAYHSATEHTGGVFVVEGIDDYGRSTGVVAQSWIWRNGNRVCFDNVEINRANRKKLEKEGGFAQIYSIYQRAAEQMVRIDTAALKKKLDAGEITQEQYDKLVISDVTIGDQFEKLIKNLPEEIRSKIPMASIILPKEYYEGKTYQVGSEKPDFYSDAKSGQYLIYHNNEATYTSTTPPDIQPDDVGVKYYLLRDIKRRKGKNLDLDTISQATKIAESQNDKDSIFGAEPQSADDVRDFIADTIHIGYSELNIDDVSMSMSCDKDWYMLSAETEKDIHIVDLFFSSDIKDNTEATKYDKKMALGEYSRELLILMLEAHDKGKGLVIDAKKDSIKWILDSLLEREIIMDENGIITVKNPEKIRAEIEATTQNLEDWMEKRAISGIEVGSEAKSDDEISME